MMNSDPSFAAGRPDDNAAAAAGGEESSEMESGGRSSVRLIRARRVFVAASGLTGALAPWLFGGEGALAQWVLLAGALLTAVAGFRVRALCVRTYSGRAAWKLAQVCLACAAVLLVLMLLQALNPAFRFEGEESGRLAALSAIPWLPQSISDATEVGSRGFEVYSGAWRSFLMFGTGWLYVIGLAAGFRERNNARTWATFMALNGALLAVVSILHSAIASKLTWWVFASERTMGGSVFLLKGQEAAYLAAVLAIVCGLASSELETKRRRRWELIALLLWVGAILGGSYMGAAAATLALLVYWRVGRKAGAAVWDSGALTAWVFGTAVTGVIVAAILLSGDVDLDEFGRAKIQSPSETHLGTRAEHLPAMMREVGLAMWVDRPITGWGGGAYAKLFPIYGEKVISMAGYLRSLPVPFVRPSITSAKCDMVEFLVEHGVVGLLLLVAIFGVQLHGWIYWRGWKNALALFLVVGVLGLLVHASSNEILRNPALLLLFSGMQVAAVRLAAPSKGKKPGKRVRRTRREVDEEPLSPEQDERD